MTEDRLISTEALLMKLKTKMRLKELVVDKSSKNFQKAKEKKWLNKKTSQEYLSTKYRVIIKVEII